MRRLDADFVARMVDLMGLAPGPLRIKMPAAQAAFAHAMNASASST